MTTPLTTETFAGFLHALDDEELAVFVADLWAAAGWETRVDGREVIASRDGTATERRFYVVSDDRSPIDRFFGRETPDPPDGYDAVVLGYRTGGTDRDDDAVVDAEDIYDRLLFSLDRETCRDLCERHFGRAVEPQPDRGASTTGVPLFVRLRTALVDRESRQRAVASTVVLVLLLAAAVVAGNPFGGSSAPDIDNATGASDISTPVGGGFVPTDTPEPTTASEPTPTEPSALLSPEGRLVPIEWANFDYIGATPTCNRTPQEVVGIYLAAARLDGANDTRRFKTMYDFTDDRLRPPFSEFDEYVMELKRSKLDIMFSFRLAYFGYSRFMESPNPNSDRPDRSTIRQNVVLIGNGTTQTIEFVLTKRQSGPDRGCWKVQTILFVSEEDSAFTATPTAGAVSPDDKGTPTEPAKY